MKSLGPLTDPVYTPDPNPSALDRFFVSMMRDPRDLPFIYTTFKIVSTMIPLGLSMYFIPTSSVWWWVIAFAYFVINNFVYKGSFGLMLHCTSHRKWFKKEYEVFNYFLPWVVGPFFGQTPGTYFSHHIGMHHPENNLPEDRSTTMPYQRNNFGSFMLYFLNFLVLGLITLSSYFIQKNRLKLLRKSLSGEFMFIMFCVLMSLYVSFPATFMVFIFPFIVSRFIMMVGNFAQHSFVDPNDPGNAYKNSITCVNVKYNHKCWNDGYHISHHIKPTLHWTEHPVYFMDTLEEYVEHKALVFDGIGFLGVFILLMTHQYEKLTKYVVNINGMWSSEEEVIETMKHRNKRIPRGSWQPVAA